MKHNVSQTFWRGLWIEIYPGGLRYPPFKQLGPGEKSNLVHNRGFQIVPFLCYFLPQIISRFVSKGVRFQQLKVLKILWTRKVRRKGSRKCSVESGKFTGSFEKRAPAWILDYLLFNVFPKLSTLSITVVKNLHSLRDFQSRKYSAQKASSHINFTGLIKPGLQSTRWF